MPAAIKKRICYLANDGYLAFDAALGESESGPLAAAFHSRGRGFQVLDFDH